MSWSCDIVANKNIDESDVIEIISNLPDMYKSPIPGLSLKKQMWGWSTLVDIHTPKNNVLTLSGSYGFYGVFRPKIEVIVEYYKEKLEELGYEIKLDYCW